MSEVQTTTRSWRQLEAAAHARLPKGEPGTAIEAEFVKEGLEASQAREIVDRAVHVARTRALGLLVGSAIFALLGLLVTLASFSTAASSPNGGAIWIWYGPIVAGGISSLVAIAKLMAIRR